MANERYEMTPLGLLTLDMPEPMAKKAIDRLTLHMLRHYGPVPGIVLENGQLLFVRLEASS